MRLVHALGAAVAATTLVASVAQATLTPSLVQIPVDSGAANSIAPGQVVRTFLLKVNQNAEKFDVTNLQLNLSAKPGLSGYLYANPTVHDDAKALNSGFLSPSTSAAFYDTYVTSPMFNANPSANADHLAVTGSADYPVGTGTQTPGVPKKATNNTSSNRSMNIVWGDPKGGDVSNTPATAGNPASTYTIAQFTVVGNTGGYLNGYFGGTGSANTAEFFSKLYLPIAGDTNLDHIVDLGDFNNVTNNLFTSNPAGDTDANGIVDLGDFNNVTNNLFLSLNPGDPGVALGAVVPEPSSILAIAGALSAGMIRRRR